MSKNSLGLRKGLLHILGIAVFISCTNKKETIEYYENGHPTIVYIYEKEIKQDLSVHYYEIPKGVVKTMKW